MMRDLPSGTVTFLFTDIEGSTRLLHELGAEAFSAALADHRRLLRDVFARHGGVEVDTQGDAFFIAFGSASEAVTAADEAQQLQEGGPVRIRIGIHTGRPVTTAEGYVGIDVHRAARICAAAHGGQVVLSGATVAALGGAGSRQIVDQGLHRLKDLADAERLYQLGNRAHPPLRSLNASNLPVQPNPLIGRRMELEEVLALARNGARVVTLTGPGGSGKTRLGLQAAADLTTDFRDGVFWVPLAPLRDPTLVVATIEQTLGATVPLADHVDEKRLLLLLDNFEQVADAARELAVVLQQCPNLRLLVTSRAPLRISGEREYSVQPLPDDDAVMLFRQRAVISEPLDAVREICRRLDGLPLAIELAAARTRLLPPDELLARLDRRLAILGAGARDAPERQRTLRATIEWSHDLLTEWERRLFARIGVFAGSFTVAACQSVCDADLETLESLLEKNLLRRWPSGRMGMLETIREFALEQLDASMEADVIRRRHAIDLLALAEAANLDDGGRPEAVVRLELVLPEIDNLRAALDWASTADTELGLRLASAFALYWVANSPAEGRRWLSDLIERNPNAPAELRASALRSLGGAVYIVGDFAEGTRLHEASLAEFRRLGDELGAALMLIRLAIEAQRVGDTAKARALGEEGLMVTRRHGSTWGQAQALYVLGDACFGEGRHEEAFELLQRSAALAEKVGYRWWQASALLQVAEYQLVLGRPGEARSSAHEALSISSALADRQTIVFSLAVVAWIAAETGDAERAGRIWGAIEAEEQRARIGQWEEQSPDYAAHLSPVAGPAFEAARAEGRGMALDVAVDYALAVGPQLHAG